MASIASLQLLYKLLSKNLVFHIRQTMQIAKLKTVNAKEHKQHQHLFDQMMHKPGLLFLKVVFTIGDKDLRIAGGAVRDLMCEKMPDDIDLATPATPDEMIELLG